MGIQYVGWEGSKQLNSSVVNTSGSMPYTEGNNGTFGASQEHLAVHLSTVLVNCFLLFIVQVLGILGNLLVLLATRCSSSVRKVQYFLYYSLCVINLLFCLLWAPLEMGRLVLNHNRRGMDTWTCYANAAFYHFFIGVIVMLVFFITIQCLCHVWYEQACFSRKVFVWGALVCVLVGSVILTPVILEYPLTHDYLICTQTYFTGPRDRKIGHKFKATIAVTLFLLLSLICVIIAFVIVLLKKRKQILQQMTTPKLQSRQHLLYNNEHSTSDIKQSSSKQGSLSIAQDSIEENPSSETKPHKASTERIVSGRGGISFKTPVTNDSDEECNDEEYERKMMQRVRKTGSGRRHTVANIALGETSQSGRRRSVDRASSPRALNYQYVRKWSVDITALQEQLENPKAHSGFSDLALLKEATPQNAKKKESVKNKEVEKIDENPEVGVDVSGDVKDTCDKTEQPQGPSNHCKIRRVPTITINDSNGEGSKVEESPPPVEKKEENIGSLSETEGDETEVACAEARKDAMQRLRTASICLFLILLAIACTLPYAILQALQFTMPPNMNRNVSAIAAAVFLVQIPFHPLFIVWMESAVWKAVRRLWFILTHWTCVCYCNIGPTKGQRCLKHSKYEDQVSG